LKSLSTYVCIKNCFPQKVQNWLKQHKFRCRNSADKSIVENQAEWSRINRRWDQRAAKVPTIQNVGKFPGRKWGPHERNWSAQENSGTIFAGRNDIKISLLGKIKINKILNN